jgi:hypothetical protein
MKAFEGLFDGVSFKKGTEIAFSTHHKGQLVAQIDGKQVGCMRHADDSVSPGGFDGGTAFQACTHKAGFYAIKSSHKFRF